MRSHLITADVSSAYTGWSKKAGLFLGPQNFVKNIR